MPNVNLAPGTQYIIAAQRRRRTLYVLAAVVAIIVLTVYVGLFMYKRQLEQQRNEVQADIRNVEMEIAKLQEDANEVVLFEERLASLDALLDSHVQWDLLFNDLERLLPPETVVTRTSIALNEGTMSLLGTTPDVDKLAQTLASFTTAARNDESVFTEGTVGRTTRKVTEGEEEEENTVNYEFSAELMFDEQVLRSGGR